MSFVISIDQGTSSTKTIVFDSEGKAVARGSEPLKTWYTEGGFAEQDPFAIYENVLASVAACLADFKNKGYNPSDIKACGISNQRETFVVWDSNGTPLYNAVVWQCKRSVDICEALKGTPVETLVRERTGLIIDPYFSGTKLMWLNREVPVIREAMNKGHAMFGTIDTWLLYQLTKRGIYLTDHTNASRTMFLNLERLEWDEEIIGELGLSGIRLPALRSSSSDFGLTDFNGLLDHPIPVTGMIGDSHAAAFGEGCFEPGYAKATLGTGCSVLMNTGGTPVKSEKGMVTTICWSTEGRVDYALEGVIVSCGATIEWLRNELNLFLKSGDAEAMATAVSDNQGVYVLPAFGGMGAPHWRMNSRGVICGLRFNTSKDHIVRAALESIPYQVKDVMDAMESDAALPLRQLMTDGGITANSFVMQSMADLLEKPLVTIGMPDVSALGAAYMAGLKAGVYKDIAYLQTLNTEKRHWKPTGSDLIQRGYKGWQQAIAQYITNQ